ncbi:MAG: hypothetical protein ACSHX0_08725 [Akkermansiaceae bacterium]
MSDKTHKNDESPDLNVSGGFIGKVPGPVQPGKNAQDKLQRELDERDANLAKKGKPGNANDDRDQRNRDRDHRQQKHGEQSPTE